MGVFVWQIRGVEKNMSGKKHTDYKHFRGSYGLISKL